MTNDELRTAALTWLGLDPTAAGLDADAAAVVAPAVRGFVDALPAIRRTLTDTGETAWATSTALGAIMLAARLIRRRNSPAGIEAFTSDAAVYVSRQDPDVAQLLRVGPYAPPRVG